MSYEIATVKTYEVLEARRRRGELAPPPLDNVHRRAYRVSGYRPFIADVDDCGDSADPNAPVMLQVEPAPLWRDRGSVGKARKG